MVLPFPIVASFGYSGTVRFDDEAEIFHGEVLGLRDVVTFQGTTV